MKRFTYSNNPFSRNDSSERFSTMIYIWIGRLQNISYRDKQVENKYFIQSKLTSYVPCVTVKRVVLYILLPHEVVQNWKSYSLIFFISL